jgi:threonine dehydrogenase-like Zn-dependent dehydrogenase
VEQLFFVEPSRVEWRDIAVPRILDPEDALVHPLAVATCDLDTALVYGEAPFPGPFPLGHEGIGEVVEVGDRVEAVQLGQRVVIPFQISCGRCSRCRRGLTASCERAGPGAMYGLEPLGGPWGGFLGDLVRVPWADHMLVPLPDGVDPVDAASLSDNIVDAWRTVGPFVDDPRNMALLVIGGATPSLPFYTVAIAKALGVEHIDYLEFQQSGSSEAHAAKAARVGANIVESRDRLPAGRYPLTVCSVGHVDALKTALRATEPDGACVVNAIFFQDDVPLPMLSMYSRGVRLITGRVNARSALPKVLDLVASGALQPQAATDAAVPWHDAADALVAKPQKLVIHR